MRLPLLASLALVVATSAACSRQRAVAPQAPSSTAAPSTDRGGATTPAATTARETELERMLLALRRIHFPYDATTLSVAARDTLTAAAASLARYPDVRLAIEGHADERGTDEYNIALSERRARVVFDFLVDLGVDAARLEVVPHGENLPLRTGDDAVTHAKNRRVDFRRLAGTADVTLADGDLVDDDGRPLARAGGGIGDAPAARAS